MAAAREVKKEEVEEEEQKEEDDADSEVSPGSSSSTESSQPGEASTDDADSEGRHSHQFTVKFPKEMFEFLIDCEQPRTVLDAIESRLKFKKKSDSVSNIIIQRSNNSIATHFPCSCIDDQECLTIILKGKEVEKAESQPCEILPRHEYSVFYISKTGGEKMVAMKLWRCNPGPNIDYLCVYAKKGTSVKEALERDGRFVDLDDFKLSEVENPKEHTLCIENVDNLNQKKFKICRDKKPANRQQGQQEEDITEKVQSLVLKD